MINYNDIGGCHYSVDLTVPSIYLSLAPSSNPEHTFTFSCFIRLMIGTTIASDF